MVESSAQLIEELNQKLGEMQDNFLRAKAEGENIRRRAVVEASQGEERAKLMSNLKEGSVVQGIVKNITDYA